MDYAYFDHNATTPMDPLVLEAMQPFFLTRYANASSLHQGGRIARAAVDQARRQVAQALGVTPNQVIFTSGGTEANNLAIKGLAATVATKRIVVSPIEHPCVRVPAFELEWSGWQMHTLRTQSNGQIDLSDAGQALQTPAGLVAVMVANNETGVIQEIAALSALAHQAGALLHADAVQGFGKIAVDFNALGADTLSIAGHKIYGPKGIGALILGPRVDPLPLLTGGSHERGLRAGTENVPGIVGLGVACELAVKRLAEEGRRLAALRDRLEAELLPLGAVIFGHAAPRVPNTCYFAIPGIDGPTLAGALDAAGFAVATGSACAAGKTDKPSDTLTAMRIDPALAAGAIRVSFGKSNTLEQTLAFARAVADQVARRGRRA